MIWEIFNSNCNSMASFFLQVPVRRLHSRLLSCKPSIRKFAAARLSFSLQVSINLLNFNILINY
jgi:hypothetical protein